MSHETDEIQLPSSRLSSASKQKPIDRPQSSNEIHRLTNETHSNKHEEQTTTNNNHSHSHQQTEPSTDEGEYRKPATPPIAEQKPDDSTAIHPLCKFKTEKKWLDLQFHQDKTDESGTQMIKKPDELVAEMEDPPEHIKEDLLDRIQGSIIGMALGDSLGAHVEFRPHEYMVNNPVTELLGGGTWGLEIGQFTDDTSMALCLANSLIARGDFVPYDQLVRYKWWNEFGYMSSTGNCFDIGAATSQSIHQFQLRQRALEKEHKIPIKKLDNLSDTEILNDFPVYCSDDEAAGNGALMRLAPVPLFFFRNKYAAVEFSGRSGQITHGSKKAYDACRFMGALIVAALRGYSKEQILARNFYSKHQHWFGKEPLEPEIIAIAEGSYKKQYGYEGGIRGKGYIVLALEAALWAFWSDGGSFKKGALAAVNLGDDTDTTAAIYGQLAGAYYGYKKLPKEWLDHIYALEFLEKLSKWIAYEGEQWDRNRAHSFINGSSD